MITRLEINGFKSFQQFEIDFEPFHIIVGANASGKSNIFDALRLLALLSVQSAGSALYDSSLRGEPLQQFTKLSDNIYSDRISIAAEFLLGKNVKDDFGRIRELRNQRLRYEIELFRTESEVWIKYEKLSPIRKNKDNWVNKYLDANEIEYNTTKNFIYKSKKELLVEGDSMHFAIRGENKRNRIKIDAYEGFYIPKSMLTQVNDIEYTHAFAVKKELENWKFLNLKPEKIRLPSSPFERKESVTEEGEGVAGFLFKNKNSESFILNDISRDLARMIPGIKSVTTEKDISGNIQGKIILDDNVEHYFPSLSEGTLRIIALSTFKRDLSVSKVLFFEEPENGIHPSRLNDLVYLFKGIFTNFFNTDFSDIPFRQLIINTHSPLLVSSVINNKEVFGEQKAGISLMEIVAKISDGRLVKCSKIESVPIVKGGNGTNYELENKVLSTKLKRLLEGGGLKMAFDKIK